MIYFDNAATTEMSEAALSALIEVSKNQYGNPSSIYGMGRRAREIVEESRRTIATCIGADPEEIFFTSCGTESDNWAIKTGSISIQRVITTTIEHHAVLNPVKELEALGKTTILIDPNKDGIIEIAALQEAIDREIALVSVMLQNNETGMIQDVPQLSSIVHSNNARSLFHTDAVQAVGHLPIDVKSMGIDMLSASAHKFNGPKGVGFLYKRKDCLLPPFLDGGGQEKGLRSGTENVAGIYSMAMALEDNIKNQQTIHAHIEALEKRFFISLNRENIRYRVNGNSSKKAAGIINIAFAGLDGEGLLNVLDTHDICISVGSACNSKSTERSHVLLAMGLDNTTIDSSIRISIGRYNTEEEIDCLVNAVKHYRQIVLGIS